MTGRTVEVAADHPYRVEIGPGVLAQLPALVGSAARVAIIHPAVLANRAEVIAAQLGEVGSVVTLIEVPDAEAAKTAEVLADCWQQLAEAGFTRSDVVVGLGGGATTDLAGFVAASWLRGVGFVSIPTTVLGMVDAAVGGKTGINLPAGKNLVGAFHEPLGVLCDLDTLIDLPLAEVRQGLAEVVKCGFIADPQILELIEQDPADAVDVTSIRFAELVRRAVQVKATVVSADLREATSTAGSVGRETLNYGHTLGHAIEQLAHFSWRHGEAISLGMIFAAELSAATLGLGTDVVDRHRSILTALGLPTVHTVAEWPQLRQVMSLDKKTRGTTLRFIGLAELGRVELIEAPAEELLERCHRSLSPQSGSEPQQ